MPEPPAKPLPDVAHPLAAPFWAAARERRIELQRCAACGYVRWPPARVCPQCLSAESAWRAVAGTGEVWSFAVYRRALHPAFADAIPYTVAAVTLDAGPLMIGVIPDPPADLAIGERVGAVFEDVTDALTLVRFAVERA